MREPEDSNERWENSLLLGIYIFLLFSSPLMTLWSATGNVWYLPYLLWFAVILLIAWTHGRLYEP